MADLQPDVPQKCNKALQRIRIAVHALIGHEYEDVDIRSRMQLAPSVTADRDQGGPVRELGRVSAPGSYQHFIDKHRTVAYQSPDRFAGPEALRQPAGPGLQRVPKQFRVSLAGC